jgi:hypothetical protein
MNNIADAYPLSDELFSDKLVIASYLHDTGMSVDPGFRHGIESRIICESFLEKMNLSKSEYTDLFDAVENHDNKEYATKNKPGDLLTVLSVADDLDAFGLIGVYRYLEIYLERKVPQEELGYRILKNSETRFLNFLGTYGSSKELVEKHSKRYEVISSFFNAYNEQIPFYNPGEPAPRGYSGITDIIHRKLYTCKRGNEINNLIIDSPDPLIQWFFTELNNEFASYK